MNPKAYTRLNIAAFKPMPSESTTTAAMVNPGALASWRTADLASPAIDPMSICTKTSVDGGIVRSRAPRLEG